MGSYTISDEEAELKKCLLDAVSQLYIYHRTDEPQSETIHHLWCFWQRQTRVIKLGFLFTVSKNFICYAVVSLKFYQIQMVLCENPGLSK